jgi:hypothetical protein
MTIRLHSPTHTRPLSRAPYSLNLAECVTDGMPSQLSARPRTPDVNPLPDAHEQVRAFAGVPPNKCSHPDGLQPIVPLTDFERTPSRGHEAIAATGGQGGREPPCQGGADCPPQEARQHPGWARAGARTMAGGNRDGQPGESSHELHTTSTPSATKTPVINLTGWDALRVDRFRGENCNARAADR